MANNNIINREDAAALVPEDMMKEIFQGVVEESVVLKTFKKLRNMSTNQLRLNVLESLPVAGFVNSTTGLKPTSKMKWEKKYINAEEIAVVIPVPDDVRDDADYDIMAEMKPKIIEAFGIVIDGAVLFGTDAPDTWPTNVVASAIAAGNTVTEGTGTDIYDDILGTTGTISKLESDGFMATGHIGAISMRGKLRGLRNSNGDLVFSNSMQSANSYLLDGDEILFPKNGAFVPATASLISGDFNEAVYSIRQDMKFEIFHEGVISDAAGNILYNCLTQDLSVIRVKMRLGWQVPNPVNAVQGTEASRYPFTVLVP